MVIPKINSAHGSDTRNIINAAIDSINTQGKSIQDLVAEGQLTPAQYATLISIVNRNVSKGNITEEDLDKNNFKLDQTYLSESLLQMIAGNTPVNAVPSDDSITTSKMVDGAINFNKLSESLLSLVSGDEYSTGDFGWSIGSFNVWTGEETPSSGSTRMRTDQFVRLKKGMRMYLKNHEDFKFRVLEYDYFTNDFIRITDFFSSGYHELEDDYSVRIILSKKDDSKIETNEIQSLANALYVEKGPIAGGSVQLESLDRDLKSMLKLKSINPQDLNWTIGSINAAGYDLDSTTRIRSEYFPITSGMFRKISSDVKQSVVVYSMDGYTFERSSGISNLSSEIIVDDGVPRYIRLLLGFTDDRIVTEENIDELISGISIGYPKTENSGISFSPHIFSDDLLGVFSTSNIENLTNPVNAQVSEVISLYDDLRADFPDYISLKKDLGSVDGENIYSYTFSPHTLDSNAEIKIPKVILLSGTHGNEKNTVYSLFNFLKKVCTDWRDDKILEFFRFNVEFVVVPIVNPVGFNAHTRNNGNNVDLNRNFPANSTEITDNLQPETKIIMNFLSENKDVEYVLDYHRMFFRDGYMAYALLDNINLNQMANKTINTMGRKWQKDYDFFPQDEKHKFGYTDSHINGTLAKHAELYGGEGILIEMVEAVKWKDGWSMYDDLTVLTGTELLANMLKGMIKLI